MTHQGNWSVGQVAVAGAAGGLAEVLWIALVAPSLGIEAWRAARAVTATLAPVHAAASFAPVAGLTIHFALSFALASVFAGTLGRHLRGLALFAAAIAALGAVWAFNFLVLLPAVNPAFTALFPHPVTLVSKLMFGLAMAAVLHRVAGRRPQGTEPHTEMTL